MSNIWHDISPKRINSQDFICVIEITKGSKKKQKQTIFKFYVISNIFLIYYFFVFYIKKTETFNEPTPKS